MFKGELFVWKYLVKMKRFKIGKSSVEELDFSVKGISFSIFT